MKKKLTSFIAQLKCKYLIKHPWVTAVAEFLFIITSFALAAQGFFMWTFEKNSGIFWSIFALWIFAVIIKIWSFLSTRLSMAEFKRMQLSEKLSATTLLAQQKANEAKSMAILQMTYGHVPEWHSANLQENVLVYDVHEQLRTILIEIRNAVLASAGETDADMVTVDLAYCYPSKGYRGGLPASKDRLSEWRIITSGDSSCTNYKLHDFLGSCESFYFHLDKNNYAFFNDKQGVDRYYLPSGKDLEYGGVGSIVGMTINIKNDVPEKVLVKAMLTLTTYGWNLCVKNGEISEEDFKKIFKQKVLNGYKSLLESELAQMYIRHMIRDNKMCPLTGIVMADEREDTNEPPQPPFICPLNPQRRKKKCPYRADACKCMAPRRF